MVKLCKFPDGLTEGTGFDKVDLLVFKERMNGISTRCEYFGTDRIFAGHD